MYNPTLHIFHIKDFCYPYLATLNNQEYACTFASHQCADYARASYAGVSEERVAHVMFAVGEEKLFSVCTGSIQIAMALPCCCLRPTSPQPKNTIVCNQLHLSESSISECVRLRDALWPILCM